MGATRLLISLIYLQLMDHTCKIENQMANNFTRQVGNHSGCFHRQLLFSIATGDRQMHTWMLHITVSYIITTPAVTRKENSTISLKVDYIYDHKICSQFPIDFVYASTYL